MTSASGRRHHTQEKTSDIQGSEKMICIRFLETVLPSTKVHTNYLLHGCQPLVPFPLVSLRIPPPTPRTPYSLSNNSKNLIELVQSTSLAIRIGKNNSTFKYQTFCTYICLQLITVINALLQLYLLTPIYKYTVAGSIHMTLSMDLSLSCEYFKATVTTDTY